MQNVHSKEQIHASGESGGKDTPQVSHTGLSNNIHVILIYTSLRSIPRVNSCIWHSSAILKDEYYMKFVTGAGNGLELG